MGKPGGMPSSSPTAVPKKGVPPRPSISSAEIMQPNEGIREKENLSGLGNYGNDRGLDTCQVLIGLLKEQSSDPEVTHATLRAIDRITEAPGQGSHQFNRRRLLVIGGYEVLSSILILLPKHVEILTCALCLMCSLASEEGSNTRFRNVPDAFEGVLGALKAFPSYCDIQYYGIQALALLACGDEESCRTLVSLGGGEVIASCLDGELLSEIEFNRHVIRLAFALGSQDEGKKKFDELRVIGKVLDLLGFLRGDAEIQSYGWRLIGELVMMEGSREGLEGELMGCKTVLSALSTLGTDARAQEGCLKCLTHMASVDETNRNILKAEGACDLLLSLISADPTNRTSSYYALEALPNLASGFNPRFCDMLINVMKQFALDMEIQESCCQAITSFTFNDLRNGQTLGAAVCGLIVESFRQFPAERNLQYLGLKAIISLLRTGKDLIGILGRERACEGIIEVLVNFPFDKDIQRYGCYAITLLAENGENTENIKRLAAVGAGKRVCAALNVFALDRDVRNQALRAISALSQGGNVEVPEVAYEGLQASLFTFEVDGGVHLTLLRILAALSFTNTGKRALGRMRKLCKALIALLNGGPEDRDLQLIGCQLLANVSSCWDEKIQQAFGEQALQCMLYCLYHFVSDPEIKKYAYLALCTLAPRRDKKTLLGVRRLCETLLTFFEDFPSDADLCSSGLEAIGKLAELNPNTRKIMATLGAFEKIFAAISMFSSRHEIICLGLKAISHLVSHAQNKETFAATDRCEKVVVSLRLFDGDYEVLCCGLELLDALSNGHEGFVDKFVSAGACELVVSAVKKYQSDRTLQILGLKCIGNLAFQNDEGKRNLGSAGAPVLVLALLKDLGGEHDASFLGLRAVSNLADGSEGINSKSFYDAGLIRTLMETLVRFRSDSSITKNGCLAIVNLCFKNPSFCISLGASGFCGWAISNFTIFRSDADIMGHSCWALGDLCYQSVENTEKSINLKIVAKIQDIFMSSTSNASLKYFARRVFVSMAYACHASQSDIAPIACEMIMETMIAYKTNSHIFERACCAIVDLACGDPANIKTLKALGVCELLLSALKNFSSDREATCQGLHVVRVLSFQNPEIIKSFEIGGGVDVIVEALTNFEKDMRIQFEGCR